MIHKNLLTHIDLVNLPCNVLPINIQKQDELSWTDACVPADCLTADESDGLAETTAQY